MWWLLRRTRALTPETRALSKTDIFPRALTIANGVLLAGFDENFVSERYLRRSYGILWERAVEQLRDPDTPHRVEVCPFDKCDIARDMAKWLLRSVGDLGVAALDLCSF